MTTHLARWMGWFVVVGCAGTLSAANVDWDGGGTTNASGSWETLANWTGDNKPQATDTARLLDVTAGQRTVTVDSAEQVTQLLMTQATVGPTNALQLNASLTLTGTTPLNLTPTAGVSNLVIDVGGQTLVTSNANNYTITLNGTLNAGPGALLDFRQYGNQSGMIITNLGVWVQNGATSRWNFAVAGANVSAMGRRFSNAGTWVLTNGSAFALAGPVGVGGFSILDSCLNTGSLSLFGSSMMFASLINRGTLELGSNAVMAAGGNGVPMLTCASGAVFRVTGAGAWLGTNCAYYAGDVGSQMAIEPGASLTLRYTTGGTATFTNSGTLVQNGGNLAFDWIDSVNNSVYSRFRNNGTWTMTNGAQVLFLRQGTPYAGLGGYGSGSGSANYGTMTILDTAALNFNDLLNAGTLNVGGGAGTVRLAPVGNPPVINNGVNGTINAGGSALFGTNTETAGIAFNNGSATATGAVFNVGDGTNAAAFTIAYGDARLRNYPSNAVTVAAGATLSVFSFDDGSPHPFNSRDAFVTNGGTFTLAGTLQLKPNHGATYHGVYNTGTVIVKGTNAVLQRMPNAATATSADTEIVTYGGAVFGGGGKLTYTNSSGSGNLNTNRVTVAGTLSPGDPVGTLELANTAVTITNGTMVVQLYDPDTFDKLKVSGTGARLNLSGTADVLNVSLVDKFRWESVTTFRIYEGGPVSGTFETYLWNGAPRTDEYTVTYGANYIDISVIPAPGTVVVVR